MARARTGPALSTRCDGCPDEDGRRDAQAAGDERDPDDDEDPHAGLEVARRVPRGTERERTERGEGIPPSSMSDATEPTCPGSSVTSSGNVSTSGNTLPSPSPRTATHRYARSGSSTIPRIAPVLATADATSCDRRPPNRSAMSGTPRVVIRPTALVTATSDPAAAVSTPVHEDVREPGHYAVVHERLSPKANTRSQLVGVPPGRDAGRSRGPGPAGDRRARGSARPRSSRPTRPR